MNKALAVAIGGVLVAGAAVGAYRSGMIGTPYAQVTSARPIVVKEDVFADVVDARPVTRTVQVSQQVCEDRVVQTKVTLGRCNGERVEVLFGLSAGVRVVESGAGFLADGDAVKVAAQ